MPVPYKPKPKSTNMGEKIVKTEVRKAQMSKPSPKPKPVSEADKKKAEQLKKSYEQKMLSAAQQQRLGQTQMKNNVKQGSMGSLAPYTKRWEDVGSPVPVGKQRVEIAEKMRTQAKKDSIGAVKLNPDAFKKKK